jgi:bacterioferritin
LEFKLIWKLFCASGYCCCTCEEKGDYITRDMLRQQMSDTEEDHTYWLEKQLRLIELIGLQNYIQSQM